MNPISVYRICADPPRPLRIALCVSQYHQRDCYYRPLTQSLLGQRRRRWADFNPTLVQSFVLVGILDNGSHYKHYMYVLIRSNEKRIWARDCSSTMGRQWAVTSFFSIDQLLLVAFALQILFEGGLLRSLHHIHVFDVSIRIAIKSMNDVRQQFMINLIRI